MIIKKPFYYIRHGETDWNLAGRFQGEQDVALNETGIRQAQNAIAGLTGQSVTHIYCSPMLRAHRTAEIINEKLNLPLLDIPDLRECKFGVLEGVLRAGHNHIDEWRAGVTPENAESYADFSDRVFAAMNHVLSFDGVPLIVAHGAVFMPIHDYTGLQFEATLPNARAIYVEPSAMADSGWDYTQL
ncbi:MAG: histidine phosphatase family protein [Rhodobacteraceae bacterium]|nr:histidine phosphatase family protein [Paracoccaceae bacterium]